MIKILIIVSVILLILLFMVLSITISKKRMRREIIKINEASENIDIYLNIKNDLLLKSKKFINNDDYKNELDEIMELADDRFRKQEILDKFNSKLQDMLYEDDDLIRNKEFIEFFENVKDNNNDLNGSIKFYNDSVNNYIKLKKNFPTNIVKVCCGFKKFDLFDTKETSNISY